MLKEQMKYKTNYIFYFLYLDHELSPGPNLMGRQLKQPKKVNDICIIFKYPKASRHRKNLKNIVKRIPFGIVLDNPSFLITFPLMLSLQIYKNDPVMSLSHYESPDLLSVAELALELEQLRQEESKVDDELREALQNRTHLHRLLDTLVFSQDSTANVVSLKVNDRTQERIEGGNVKQSTNNSSGSSPKTALNIAIEKLHDEIVHGSTSAKSIAVRVRALDQAIARVRLPEQKA